MKINPLWSVAAAVTANRLVRTRMSRRSNAVFLTFDDGPHPEHTPELLDLLKLHDARATFFLIGESAQANPDIVARIVAEGHSIGNHSMTHPRMSTLTARAQIAEIRRADAALARFNGRTKYPFRPPNGRSTAAMLLYGLWRGQPTLLWSVDTLDYRLTADEVVARLGDAVPASGDILLWHDDNRTACDALRRLLPAWRAAGLRFEALQAL